MGGPISLRRTNFPNVLQHDTVLQPEQCGGPVVDLDGNVVGINIARAGRVESYAVPAETILALLPRLKSGELAPKPEQIVGAEKKPAPAETKPELEAVLEEIRKAEEELRSSQEKLRKAREALEKAEEKP
jgi:serine protease Do